MSDYDNYEEQVELREQEAYNAAMSEAGREADRVQSEHGAYVAELEARIAELEEANEYWSKRALVGERWIPVSERLPEESDWYLSNYNGYRVTYPIYYDVEYGWACGETPDHWMPLPNPPEVNKESNA